VAHPLMGAAATGDDLAGQIAKAEANPECNNKDFHIDPSAVEMAVAAQQLSKSCAIRKRPRHDSAGVSFIES